MCVMREGCSSSYLLAVRKTLFSIRANFENARLAGSQKKSGKLKPKPFCCCGPLRFTQRPTPPDEPRPHDTLTSRIREVFVSALPVPRYEGTARRSCRISGIGMQLAPISFHRRQLHSSTPTLECEKHALRSPAFLVKFPFIVTIRFAFLFNARPARSNREEGLVLFNGLARERWHVSSAHPRHGPPVPGSAFAPFYEAFVLLATCMSQLASHHHHQ